MARSVADCAKADAVIANEEWIAREPVAPAGLRIGIAQGMPLDKLEEPVARGFDVALKRLSAAGAWLTEIVLPEIDGMVEVNTRYGGIAPAEAFYIHRERLDTQGDRIDPNVRLRIDKARSVSAADYIAMLRRRAELARAVDARLVDIDVLAMPTSAVVAPVLAELNTPEVWARRNAMSLRNTSMWNFFDTCAISLPLPRDGGLPVGLMLVARHGHDARLFRVAEAVERALA
jgi:aspartyl-tRNA(Asn)/glutamyl-tRNA(Gln) amidotransferase subunit A